MKSVLLLSVYYDTYVTNRYKKSCEKLGYELLILKYRDLSLNLKKGELDLTCRGESINLDKFDIVICRNPSEGRSYHSELKYLSGLLEFFISKGKRVINGDSVTTFSAMEDKLFQSLFFSSKGFPTIDTLHFNNAIDADSYFKDKSESIYPLIAKPRYGSQGKGIKLVENFANVRRIIDYEFIENYIFQEFIPNDLDLRVIASKKEVFGAMSRSRTSGIVNNYSAGGKIADYSELLTEELESLSLKIVEATKADYLGIDFILNKETNEFKLLEINRFCQFTGFEKVTGIDIPAKILELV